MADESAFFTKEELERLHELAPKRASKKKELAMPRHTEETLIRTETMLENGNGAVHRRRFG